MSAIKSVYLDNYGTTLCSQASIDAQVKWMNSGNASGEYKEALAGRQMMDDFRREIAKFCNISIDDYMIIFTSGASEANCYIIEMVARRFRVMRNIMPHIIISKIEHSSIKQCCENLQKDKIITYSEVPVIKSGPDYGKVDIKEITSTIRSGTCLISVMLVNNETGVINNLSNIGAISLCKGKDGPYKIPVHCDLVQYFGKGQLEINKLGIDAFSVSFHKLHGPKGLGALIISRALVQSRELCGLIAGKQNYGLRGGTEPVQLIAGAKVAFNEMISNMGEKLKALAGLKKYLISLLNDKFNVYYAADYKEDKNNIDTIISKKVPFLFFICSKSNTTMSNILCFSLVAPEVCNSKIREALERRGVIIGLGSACQKGQPSHIPEALNIPPLFRNGILRISWSDYNKKSDIEKFVIEFTQVVNRGEYKSTQSPGE